MVGIEKKNGFERIYLSGCKKNTQIILKYPNSIDMTTGFCQCPLKKDYLEITAFLHKGRNYPQLLASYIDDLHITSNSFDGHMLHLEKILTKFA